MGESVPVLLGFLFRVALNSLIVIISYRLIAGSSPAVPILNDSCERERRALNDVGHKLYT